MLCELAGYSRAEADALTGARRDELLRETLQGWRYYGDNLYYSYISIIASRDQHPGQVGANLTFRSYRTKIGTDTPNAAISYDYIAPWSSELTAAGVANHPRTVNVLYLGGYVLTRRDTDYDSGLNKILLTLNYLTGSRALDNFSESYIP